MKISLNWLKHYIQIDQSISIHDIANKLISLGFEVDSIFERDDLQDFIIAEILSVSKHPNADTLNVCNVNTGSEVLQIVCGASNVRSNLKVVLAKTGCVIPNGEFQIKSTKIRGIESNGMICSASELKVEDYFDHHEGIIEIDNSVKVGSSFLHTKNLYDPVLDISITPNRGDATNAYGIAKELAAQKIGKLIFPIKYHNVSRETFIHSNKKIYDEIFTQISDSELNNNNNFLQKNFDDKGFDENLSSKNDSLDPADFDEYKTSSIKKNLLNNLEQNFLQNDFNCKNSDYIIYKLDKYYSSIDIIFKDYFDNFVSQIPNVSRETSIIRNEKACSCLYLIKINDVDNTILAAELTNILKTSGLKSISPIVDVTNYISHSLGQPLHVYDSDKINDNLYVEVLENNFTYKALDDKEYELKSGDLVVRDNKHIHCLAGIIGGMDSSCDKNTKSIILEAGIFDPTLISKTSNRLNIYTDSKARFEKGIDPSITQIALMNAANMIVKLCGGKIESMKYYTKYYDQDIRNGIVDVSEKKIGQKSIGEYVQSSEIKFDINLVEKKLGYKIECANVKNILSNLGFKCSEYSENILLVIVPSWRHDVYIPEDLIEEIVRSKGYDHLIPSLIEHQIKPRVLDHSDKLSINSKYILSNLGYYETITWSFVDENDVHLFHNISPDVSRETQTSNDANDDKRENQAFLKILNPISSHLNYMRSSILHSLMYVVQKNCKKGIDDISLFELGPIFKLIRNESDQNNSINLKSGNGYILEEECIAGVRTCVDLNKYTSKNTQRDFYDLKGDVECLLSELGTNSYQLDRKVVGYYHPHKSARIFLGKKTIGYLGYIHPKITKHFKIKSEVLGFEIFVNNLNVVKHKYGKKPDYQIVEYPVVTRDFSFIVQNDIEVGKFVKSIADTNKTLIKTCELFDVFQINQNEKSLAIRLLLQSKDKTLVDTEINSLSDKVVERAKTHFNAVLRKM